MSLLPRGPVPALLARPHPYWGCCVCGRDAAQRFALVVPESSRSRSVQIHIRGIHPLSSEVTSKRARYLQGVPPIPAKCRVNSCHIHQNLSTWQPTDNGLSVCRLQLLWLMEAKTSICKLSNLIVSIVLRMAAVAAEGCRNPPFTTM